MTSMAEDARPWRCFWAVPLPAGLRRSLAAFVSELRSVPGIEADWRFTDPDGWHLTLAFLGGIEADAVEPMIGRVAAALGAHAPMEIRTGGLGAFPVGGRARVLWYGIDDEPVLDALARAVRAAAESDDDGPLHPHVTLARSRDRRGVPMPATGHEAPFAALSVSEIVLFRSHLGGGPARYEAIARLPLRALAAAAAGR